MIEVRLFEPQDVDQMAMLFHETVRQINIRDYSTHQVKAWAPDDIYFRNWLKVCSNRFTYVAHDGSIILGFGELEHSGHIDCFYCHKDYQRCGIGKQIYMAIESKAVELSLDRLCIESSLTAKPFFLRMGFVVIQEQQAICRNEKFINYVMEKSLPHYVGQHATR